MSQYWPGLLIALKLLLAMVCGGAIGECSTIELTTGDPAELLDGLMNLLEKEGMRLEDFDVKSLAEEQSEVKISVITSLEGSRRLLKTLPELGAAVNATTEHAS